MIGGRSKDFDMAFDKTTDLGSRWISDESMTDIFRHTIRKIVKDFDVLITIHERFQESLCVLEIVYGHLQSFHWDPHTNSHNTMAKYNPNAQPADFKYRNTSTYTSWLSKNSQDIELYKFSFKFFEIQFQAGLKILKQRIARDKSAINYTPHCKSYL